MIGAIERFAARTAFWTGIGVIILMAAFTVLITIAVGLRYILGMGLEWSEEAGRYLMIWMGFLAASLALRESAHVGIVVFRAALPPRVRRWVVLAGALLVAVFLAVVTYQAVRLVIMVIPQESLVIPFSMAWPYLAIPIGSSLMLLQLLSVTIRQWEDDELSADRGREESSTL